MMNGVRLETVASVTSELGYLHVLTLSAVVIFPMAWLTLLIHLSKCFAMGLWTAQRSAQMHVGAISECYWVLASR